MPKNLGNGGQRREAHSGSAEGALEVYPLTKGELRDKTDVCRIAKKKGAGRKKIR